MLTTAKSRVVVSQPYHDVWTYEHYWQTGLSSCFDNCAQCAFAFFCYWCFVSLFLSYFMQISSLMVL